MINIKSIYFLSFRHIIESEHVTPTVLLAKGKHSLQHKNYLLTHRRLLNNPYALCNANKEIPHLIHRVLLRIELQICFFPILLALTSLHICFSICSSILITPTWILLFLWIQMLYTTGHHATLHKETLKLCPLRFLIP